MSEPLDELCEGRIDVECCAGAASRRAETSSHTILMSLDKIRLTRVIRERRVARVSRVKRV